MNRGTMMNAQELSTLLAQGEGESIEFKRSTGEMKEAMQTLCAFLHGVGVTAASTTASPGGSRSESGQGRRSQSLVAEAGAPTEIRVLAALTNGPLARSGVVRDLGRKSLSGEIRKAISVLLRAEWIEYTVSDKPNSRLQEYRLTQVGERALREWTGGN